MNDPLEIFRHLNDALCLRTVKMIHEVGSIELSTFSSRSYIIRTKESIEKMKNRSESEEKNDQAKISC